MKREREKSEAIVDIDVVKQKPKRTQEENKFTRGFEYCHRYTLRIFFGYKNIVLQQIIRDRKYNLYLANVR